MSFGGFQVGAFQKAFQQAVTVVTQAVQASGGWLFGPRKVVCVEDDERIECQEEAAPQVRKAPAEAVQIEAKPIEYTAADLAQIEQAAEQAYMEEQARLMAEEAIRKAKRKRNAEFLLLS